jgi:hypothetical protein
MEDAEDFEDELEQMRAEARACRAKAISPSASRSAG